MTDIPNISKEKREEERYDAVLADAIEERDAILALMHSPGWEMINAWLQEEIDQRRKAYEEGSPHNMNDASIIGFQRAQLGMLRTLQDLPQKLLDAQQQAIDLIKEATGGYDATGD